MKYPNIQFAVLLVALLLAACSPTKAAVNYSMGQSTTTGCSTPVEGKIEPCKIKGATDPTAVPSQTVEPQVDITKSDDQGSVTVGITPLNLDKPGDTLTFDVSMNTHMVDLGMDLVKLATLTNDNGQTVQAIQWDGPKGGHHVEGKLTFPATYDGKPLLKGAKELTIIIKNVDVPTRLFTWQLAN